MSLQQTTSASSSIASDAVGGTMLRGAQCRACGQRMFPARLCCVVCFSRQVEPLLLGGIGKVTAFTVVRQAPPGYAGPVPYVLAMVLLGNDVHVLTHLVQREPEAWRIGDAVLPCTLTLPGRNGDFLCHAFHPASPASRTTGGHA